MRRGIRRLARTGVPMLLVICWVATGSQLSAGGWKKKPKAESDIVSLPLKKVLNPAFAKEVAGKWIRFNGVFYSIVDHVMDLPDEYKNDFVRVMLYDAAHESGTMDAVVPKEKSDPVFAANMATDQFEIVAYIQPTIKWSQMGTKQRSVVLVIYSLTKK